MRVMPACRPCKRQVASTPSLTSPTPTDRHYRKQKEHAKCHLSDPRRSNGGWTMFSALIRRGRRSTPVPIEEVGVSIPSNRPDFRPAGRGATPCQPQHRQAAGADVFCATASGNAHRSSCKMTLRTDPASIRKHTGFENG